MNLLGDRLSQEINSLEEESKTQQSQAHNINQEIRAACKKRDETQALATSLKAQHAAIEDDGLRAKEDSRRWHSTLLVATLWHLVEAMCTASGHHNGWNFNLSMLDSHGEF